MNLKTLLSERKGAILNSWFDLVLETYPLDTANFLRSQKDQFTNPVGHTLLETLKGLLEEIINGTDQKKIAPHLENMIKVRAIQEFSPSKAIGFIFSLKKVIREELGDAIQRPHIFKDLLSLESRIDDLGIISFDIYMKCRERLYELKAEELKNWTYGLLRKANLAGEAKPSNRGL
jgi:hypothetical protein